MKALCLVGHPNVRHESVANKLIVDALAKQEDLEVRNLAELYPSFEIDIADEQEALLRAHTIVFQYPFYWYSVPGILKEWIDRVLAYGFAYGSTGKKLQGKNLLVSTTIGGPADAYRREGSNTYTIDELLMPLKQTANLCGMRFLEPVISHAMIYIPNVHGKRDEVEARATEHAERLVERLTTLS